MLSRLVPTLPAGFAVAARLFYPPSTPGFGFYTHRIIIHWMIQHVIGEGPKRLVDREEDLLKRATRVADRLIAD
jgi:hypothetical protein